MTVAMITMAGALAVSTSIIGFGIGELRRADTKMQDDVAGIAEMLANKIDHATNRLDAGRIKGNLIAMQTRYCDAVRARNIPLADSISAIISELQVEYVRVTGTAFLMRDCA
mgnify:CR=1 FL=1